MAVKWATEAHRNLTHPNLGDPVLWINGGTFKLSVATSTMLTDQAVRAALPDAARLQAVRLGAEVTAEGTLLYLLPARSGEGIAITWEGRSAVIRRMAGFLEQEVGIHPRADETWTCPVTRATLADVGEALAANLSRAQVRPVQRGDGEDDGAALGPQ